VVTSPRGKGPVPLEYGREIVECKAAALEGPEPRGPGHSVRTAGTGFFSSFFRLSISHSLFPLSFWFARFPVFFWNLSWNWSWR
jgi:hypothetical protein